MYLFWDIWAICRLSVAIKHIYKQNLPLHSTHFCLWGKWQTPQNKLKEYVSENITGFAQNIRFPAFPKKKKKRYGFCLESEAQSCQSWRLYSRDCKAWWSWGPTKVKRVMMGWLRCWGGQSKALIFSISALPPFRVEILVFLCVCEEGVGQGFQFVKG